MGRQCERKGTCIQVVRPEAVTREHPKCPPEPLEADAAVILCSCRSCGSKNEVPQSLTWINSRICICSLLLCLLLPGTVACALEGSKGGRADIWAYIASDWPTSSPFGPRALPLMASRCHPGCSEFLHQCLPDLDCLSGTCPFNTPINPTLPALLASTMIFISFLNTQVPLNSTP